MKYNTLGNTGLLVSEICFGAMTFGGKGYWTAIGQQPQDEVNDLMKTAFDSGINFYDNANAYSEGLAEEMQGVAIKTLGLPRQELVVATKVRLRMGKGALHRHLQYASLAGDEGKCVRRKTRLDHILRFAIFLRHSRTGC